MGQEQRSVSICRGRLTHWRVSIRRGGFTHWRVSICRHGHTGGWQSASGVVAGGTGGMGRAEARGKAEKA